MALHVEIHALVCKAVHLGLRLDEFQRVVTQAYAEEEQKTGLVDRLRRAGKRWFYLGVEHGEAKEIRSIVHYWLNPRDQHLNNSGWFTEQELLDWIDGKGPVVKRR